MKIDAKGFINWLDDMNKLDDWDDICYRLIEGYNVLIEYEKNPSIYNEEEIELLKSDLEAWEEECNRYKSDYREYQRYCEKNRKGQE